MPDFPILVGHGLREHELHLMEYWMKTERVGSVQYFESLPDTPPTISKLSFFPQARLQEIKELMDWLVPVMLVCGSESPVPDEFLDLGLAAIFKLPEVDQPIILPHLTLPPTQGSCFVISDSPLFRTRLRQVLRFAGKQARMDFNSVDDIAQILAAVDEWPHLILVDVDSKRVDVASLFYRLELILRERPTMRARNQMLICKDFGLPGFDLVKFRSLLSPHAKRIFHPTEALLAIIESMLFYPTPEWPATYPAPRSIQEILYGESTGSLRPGGNPGRTLPFPFLDQSARAMRRAVPFQELLVRLSSEQPAGLAMKS